MHLALCLWQSFSSLPKPILQMFGISQKLAVSDCTTSSAIPWFHYQWRHFFTRPNVAGVNVPPFHFPRHLLTAGGKRDVSGDILMAHAVHHDSEPQWSEKTRDKHSSIYCTTSHALSKNIYTTPSPRQLKKNHIHSVIWLYDIWYMKFV